MCLESDVKKRLNSKKRIAEKLVNARRVIQNKFRKAKKARVTRERDLKEKYRPITTAIEKLGENQSLLKARHIYPHTFNNDDSERIYDSVHSDYDSDTSTWTEYSTDGETEFENVGADTHPETSQAVTAPQEWDKLLPISANKRNRGDATETSAFDDIDDTPETCTAEKKLKKIDENLNQREKRLKDWKKQKERRKAATKKTIPHRNCCLNNRTRINENVTMMS